MRGLSFWRRYGHLVVGCEYEDVRQCAAIALIECLAAYRPGGSMTLRSYVWGMVPQRIVDELRACGLMVRKGRPAAQMVPLEAYKAETSIWPETEILWRDAQQTLRREAARLVPQQRTVVESICRGETLEQAGRRLGVKYARASQVRKQAIKELRARMAA